MRLLGLDIGQKRIGVAITDENATISYPLCVLENTRDIKEKISSLIDKHRIIKIIVGMPINLKGQEGHQAEKIKEFVNLNLSGIKVPVVYLDERFTSSISENILKEEAFQKKRHASKFKNKRASGEIDKLSASIILSDYIESEKKKSL
ncbi:MAG: Holliday junction resolvase RuvX [Actinobacteria bacterium]|nr:Holliday junction resolvase RuvX [Actinomycetota bacterium]